MDKLTDILMEYPEQEVHRFSYIPDPKERCIWVTEYNSDGEAIGRFKLEVTFKQVPMDL